MDITDLAVGVFAFDFKYRSSRLGTSPNELYVVRIMADSEEEALHKFHTQIKYVIEIKEIAPV